MLTLHKKVNKRETLIGWYSFCKKIMNNDPIINKILYSYTKKPLFILLWVDRLINGLIIEAYFGKKFNSNKNQIFQKKRFLSGCWNRKILLFIRYYAIQENGQKNFSQVFLQLGFRSLHLFQDFFVKCLNKK